jgi:heme oxygenase
MLTRLNIETRSEHPEADYPWLEVMSLDTTRARYIDQLVATYGFEAPVEAALQLTPHLTEVIALRSRVRSGLIVEDLLALGLSPAKIARLPQCRSVVPFREIAEALGWLYVLERSTLLHETILSNLASRMPMTSGWRYLSVYRGVATARWLDFGRALDSYAITEAAGDQVITGALAAFDSQQKWLATEPARFAREAWDTTSSGTRQLRD